jgi:hypothetical protein
MPSTTAFLTPALALVVWTLVMWLWMYVTRIPALQKAGIDPQEMAHPGSVASRIPSHVRGVADNYNHLHEQPTIFYALMFFAALTGGGDAVSLNLAWAYVVSRIVHSLIQATINKVMLRFVMFSIGTLILMAFAIRQVLRVWG